MVLVFECGTGPPYVANSPMQNPVLKPSVASSVYHIWREKKRQVQPQVKRFYNFEE